MRENLKPIQIANKIIKESGVNIFENNRRKNQIEFRSLLCHLLREKLNMRWTNIANFFKENNKEAEPKIIEDLVPNKLSVSTITQVLKNLLQEGITLRDNRSIIDNLLAESVKTKDANQLTALIRPHLGRIIVQDIISVNEELPIITLEQPLEQLLNNSIQNDSSTNDGVQANASYVISEKLIKQT